MVKASKNFAQCSKFLKNNTQIVD
jgi:dynein heavy chain